MTNRQPSLQRTFALSLFAFAMGVSTLETQAQSAGTQASTHQHSASLRKGPSDNLIGVVRAATERFHDVAAAEAEGYELMFGCVSGPDWGAMGLHYVNLALVADGQLDPARPEIVIYEPLANGRLRLIGADYPIFAGGTRPTKRRQCSAVSSCT